MDLKRILFGGFPTAHAAGDAGLALLRIYAGLALALAHGINKIPPAEGFVGFVGRLGMPAPEAAAWMSGFAEFGGGILLALGLLTRPAALLMLGNMVVVVFLAHAGDPFGDRELPLFFLFAALAFLLKGSGRYSVDALIRGRRP
jgi:putative oxidoreductase